MKNSKHGFRRFRSFERVCELLSDDREATDFDLISFDVFDTLVFRRCAPDTVLRGVAVAIADRLSTAAPQQADAILRARDAAFWELARQNEAAGRDPDALLGPLCAAWARLLLPEHPNEAIAELAAFAEQTEVEYEIWSCVPNRSLLNLCQTLQERGARLVFVSDMYLGKAVVEKILSACGFDGLFETGYVSGDVGLLKRTGRLYGHVLERECLAANKVCHIGDDELADGRMAAEKGISAWVVRDMAARRHRTGTLFDYRQLVNDRRWNGVAAHVFAAAEHVPRRTPQHQFAEQLLGLPIAVFLHGLAEYCERHVIQRVFFLSREGFVLREIYDQLVTTLGHAAPLGDYLCASRLSTGLAAMRQYGLREVNAAVAASAEVTPRRLLAPLGLSEEDLQRAAAEAGIADPDHACEVLRSPSLGRLLRHPLVADAAKEKGTSGHKALIAYLAQQGFFDVDRVVIVDVGWGAQIQENIELAIEERPDAPEVHGFYLGIDGMAVERRRAGCRIQAALIDPERYEWSGGAALDFVHLFEILTRAPHGTVTGYTETGPVFARPGSPERKNEQADDAAIAAVQGGLQHYAEHYARSMKMLGGTWSDAEQLARTLVCRMIRFPHRREVDLLIELKNISHLGSAETLTLGHRGSITSPLKFMRAVNGSLWSEGVAAHGMGILGAALLAIVKSARTARRLPPQATELPRVADLVGPRAQVAPCIHSFEQSIRDDMHNLANQHQAQMAPARTKLSGIRLFDLLVMWMTWRAANLYLRARGLDPVVTDMLSVRVWWARGLYIRRRALTSRMISTYRGLRTTVRLSARKNADG